MTVRTLNSNISLSIYFYDPFSQFGIMRLFVVESMERQCWRNCASPDNQTVRIGRVGVNRLSRGIVHGGS